MGDGAITPAISILSAVEGLQLIPSIGHISISTIILITSAITILLFAFQSRGTDKVSSSFGPIMIVWFSALLLSGIYSLFQAPQILLAVSPHYAIEFMLHNGWTGFFVLSEVILCATGGEALYADMGHLGSEPIRHAWYFVFFALVINYFGQGAYLLSSQDNTYVLFGMIRSISEMFYVPFLILTLLATIIASQAMISAVMSLVYQGITTRIFPLMKVKYTSTHLKSQIYIGVVNWILLIAVLFMIFFFEKSDNLAAAYGLAVTATMTISAMFMIWIFKIESKKYKMLIAGLVFLVDLLFLVAVMNKVPHGGYWSIVMALIPFSIIQLWSSGHKTMYRSFRPLPFDVFKESYEQIYRLGNNISGTALFFTKDLNNVPPYVVHCIIRSNIIYEKNILVSIQTTDSPYGTTFKKVENLAHGLAGIVIENGYMEFVDIPHLLKANGVTEKVIFYGAEDIVTNKVWLKIFATLKKLAPNFVAFYKLQYNKLHGVTTRLEL
jgi:KUP system potassium uptake protein